MLRDEWQETEAEVRRVLDELCRLRPKIEAATDDNLDTTQAELLATIWELVAASDALFKAVVKEAGMEDRESD